MHCPCPTHTFESRLTFCRNASTSVVLPIPASPVTKITCLSPPIARRSQPSICANADSRATSPLAGNNALRRKAPEREREVEGETRRGGDKERGGNEGADVGSPCPPVPLSPCPLVSFSSMIRPMKR